jgi:GNAT superfamily N-acetyltransferase
MYDLDPFVFYVLVDQDDQVTGFFSKEKSSPEHYNLSCILVLPQYQRKGYGRVLMELSYEIYKKNGLVGGPERPLSDLGLLGYLKYWKSVLLCLFLENPGLQLELQEIAIVTAIRIDDILFTLDSLGLLTYWKDDMLCIPHSIVEGICNKENLVFKRSVHPTNFLDKDKKLV